MKKSKWLIIRSFKYLYNADVAVFEGTLDEVKALLLELVNENNDNGCWSDKTNSVDDITLREYDGDGNPTNLYSYFECDSSIISYMAKRFDSIREYVNESGVNT